MRIVRKLIQKLKYHYNDKFFFNQWVIGIASADINEIIKGKNFDPDIIWFPTNGNLERNADPFILKAGDDTFEIFYEKYSEVSPSGNIHLMKIDKKFNKLGDEIILEKPYHLSYPFIFNESGRKYIIPETAEIGKLTYYQYHSSGGNLTFGGELIDKPLLDATLLKRNGQYWLFGMMRNENYPDQYESWVYYAEKFEGPYTSHKNNPQKIGLDGIRSAGNFIEVAGDLYRPTQNCKEKYGESITINKVCKLSEDIVAEEFYMTVSINRKKTNKGISRIHTINTIDNLIIVDGYKTTFSFKRLFYKLKSRVKKQSNEQVGS